MRYIIPLFLLLTACQTKPDLIGHWHVATSHNDEGEVSYEEHYTFDILNDTMVSIWSHPPFWNGSPCHFDHEAQNFYWNGGCLTYNWSYKIVSENELSVTDNLNNKQISLLRKNGCTIETHLFMGSKLEVSLPESNSLGTLLDDPSSLLRHYVIGPATGDYATLYTAPFHYQLGDKIITDQYAENLDLFEEQHRVKLPEAKRHLSKAIIFANAKLPANSLNDILSYTYGKPNDTLYFATLERGPDTTRLSYLPVQVAARSAPAELTVADWLACD